MVNGRRLAELAAHHAIADEFLSTFKRNEHIEPEKALLERLLTDAVDCYKKYFHSDSRVGRRRFREAKNGFSAHGPIGSFPSTAFASCSTLILISSGRNCVGLHMHQDAKGPVRIEEANRAA